MKIFMKKITQTLILSLLFTLASIFVVSAEETEETDPLYVSEEGYVIEGDGYHAVVTWCGDDNTKLFGRMYYPDDFDETQIYTTIIMNHGKNASADFWNRAYAPALAKAGYLCYTFDCRSCTIGGRGCYSDLLPDGEETSVDSYSEDLNLVMDHIESLEYVDTDRLYLFGQSMGGMTVQNVASLRPDEVRGLIVLYGAIGDDKIGLLSRYDELREKPYNAGEVLFITGSNDGTVTPEDNLDNMQWYENVTYVQISGASHGFGYMMDRPAQICTDNVVDFIERTSCAE